MDVPQRLRDLPNWVLWKYCGPERRKVPFQTNGQPAKSNDSTTWTTFQQAFAFQNGHAGIGFVFGAGQGLFGIDLDGCVSNNGDIAVWALEILSQFPTYAEISPSGTGVKIFGVGSLPGGTGKKLAIQAPAACEKAPALEVYGHGRYFTFTGRRLQQSPDDVTDCQASLDALYARFWPSRLPMAQIVSQPATDVTERARRYMAAIPAATSGQGRGPKTFRAACVLVLGFRLSPGEALPLLAEWNSRCTPQTWSEDRIDKELRRTLANAEKQPGERGWMLDGRGYTGPDADLRALLASLVGVDEPEETKLPEPPEPKNEFPQECIDNMPWLMRIAYDWTLETSIKPQPVLSFGAMLAMFGAVFGRLVHDDYDTRSNVMVLSLSPSGAGKEHPRQAVKQILYAAGLDMINGPERIGSHAGIISSVVQHPVRLFQLDEIGRLLMTMKDPKAAPHLWNIGSVLMQLYSSSNTIWIGDAYADLNKVKRIDQPVVCLFGTSVPESFYTGLSYENLSDGLLSRMLVFDAEGYGRRQKPRKSKPPEQLTRVLKAWWTPEGEGNLAGPSGEHPKLKQIPKTQEADARHEQHCNDVHQRHRNEDRERSALWSRAPEKAAKLAIIHACCSAMNKEPTISLESVDWARKIVNYATRSVIQKVSGRVLLSRWATEKDRVWEKLSDGMGVRDLSRKVQWLKGRELQEMLRDWQDCGAIEIASEPTKTKPKQVIRKCRNRP